MSSSEITTIVEMLTYGFIQRALLSSVFIGLLCSIVGIFVILRGLSFISAGISHAAFAGVALAYLIGMSPFPLAILFSLIMAWIVAYLQERGGLKPDVTIGVFYTLTMALAILFIGLMKTYNAEVYGYLFGSVLSVTPEDLVVIVLLSGTILFLIYLFYKEFQFIAFDQEMAEASGIPARRLSFLLLNLIALTIAVSLKVVGSLLVFSMIIIPAATAYQLTHTMRGMVIYSSLFGVLSSIVGILSSYWLDLPSGSITVLWATAFFLGSLLSSPKRRRMAFR